MLVRLGQVETDKIAAFIGQKEKFHEKALNRGCGGLSMLPAQAGAAGKWTGEQPGRGGAQPVTLELKADGGKLTGTMTTGQNAVQISDGTVDGSKISCKTTQNRGGNDVQVTWSGEIYGDELTLTRQGGRWWWPRSPNAETVK